MHSDNIEALTNSAQNAQDVADFEEAIGWKDVILPQLEKLRNQYATQLATAVLHAPVTDPKDPRFQLTPEILASRIYGINFIQDLITDILRKGISAIETLKSK